MWERPVFLSSSVDASLREIIIVVAMCNMNQASPIMCVGAQVVGRLTAVETVVPEPIVPILLGVKSGVTGACSSIDGRYDTPGLGPLY